MRSVWFSLVGPSPADVVACLHRHGFHPIGSTKTSGTQLRHPTMHGLYVSCEDYLSDTWAGFHDEFQEREIAASDGTCTEWAPREEWHARLSGGSTIWSDIGSKTPVHGISGVGPTQTFVIVVPPEFQAIRVRSYSGKPPE
jgi:hypothetical protein